VRVTGVDGGLLECFVRGGPAAVRREHRRWNRAAAAAADGSSVYAARTDQRQQQDERDCEDEACHLMVSFSVLSFQHESTEATHTSFPIVR
jgi:hypothetical protein